MGARASKQDVKVPHFFFGEVSQHNEYNKEIIAVRKQMIRRDDYDDWLVNYDRVKNVQKDSLLLPESYEIETVKKYMACCECPAEFQMSLSYERFDFLFKSQLVQRKKNKKQYSQEELFHILYNFSIGLKEFQLVGIRVGDIRPSQIVITNQKNLKMINLASFPWEISSIDKILEKYDNTTKFYLSPEEIDLLNKRQRVKVSDAKAEAFSVGMTLLEAATLQNSEELYEFNPRSIKSKQLNERIMTVGKKYPLFHDYLTNLLNLKPEDRLSGGQLWSTLHVYSQKIAQNQKFTKNESKQRSSLTQFRRKSSK